MKKKKILIVEDEKIVALDLRSILSNVGFSVVGEVISGKQAVAAAKELQPDIILMDIALNGTMTGIDAAKTINNAQDIPIVFLTANSDDQTLEQARQTEAFGYILKPFDDRDVRTTVEMALYKHKAQKEIKDQQRWLATTLRSIGDAVIATDKKGIVTFMNIIAEQLTGWPQEEAIGKKFSDIFIVENEDTGKRLPNPVAKVLRDRTSLSLTNHTILLSRNGARTFIEDSAAPIFTETGEITGVVLTFRDVTEKRKSQDALNKSEKRFRAMIEKSSEVVVIMDREGTILYATGSVTSMLGYSLTEYVGRSMFEFVHPDEMVQNKEKFFAELLTQPDRSVIEEVRWKHKDRTWRWIEATGTNLLSDPAVNGIVVNFRDITERKESEAKLNHLNKRLNLIARVTSEVIGALPIQKQAREMIEQVKTAFNVDAVIIRVTEDEQLHLLASIGVVEHQLRKAVPSNYGVSKQIMSSRRALAVKNVTENFASLSLIQQSGFYDKPFKFVSYAGAPLLIGHTVIGIIGLYSIEAIREFSATDLEHLQIVANHISVAIANARLFKEIREQNIEMTKHIEEQNRAEVLLRESEERYRELVEHSPTAIFVHVNGIIQFVNHATIILFGASVAGELIGRKVIDLVHPDFRANAQQRMEKVYSNYILPTTEQKNLRLDGTPIDVEISSIPFTFEGRPAAQVIARDITERKQHEIALLESELRFRSLFENAKDAVFLTDTRTGYIIDVNAEAEKLLKRSRTEIIGKHQSYIHPPERSQEAESLFREQILTLGEHAVEFEVIDSFGVRIPVEIKASVVRLDDNRIIAQGIFRDISERKLSELALRKSEEKYRRLFEDSKDGIYITTFEGVLLDVNSSMLEILGFKEKDDLKQRNVREFYYYPNDRLKFIKEFETKDYVKDFELVLKRKDGSKAHGLLTTVVIRDDNGKPLLFNGSMRDITQNKQLEQQLMQSQKMESIGTLAGGIAHDFNNLLAMILGTAELIKRHAKDNPAIQGYINRIIEASDRGSSISKQLLLFSRPEQTELQPISVHSVIEQVTAFLTHFLPKTISVHREEESTSAIIMGDGGHLHQAILNLSINARDAMPNGGIIAISARNVKGKEVLKKFSDAGDHEYVAISVKDTGSGVDDEIQQRIFEPFFSTKARGKGTGLGLAIVHGIVQLHKGFIDVNSTKGVGTTFTMYFPSIAVEVTGEQQHETSMEQHNNETILIVDDEEMLREILVESLEEEGYTLLSASDGIEALQIYAQRKDLISLVITDLGMPNMGGEELFTKLFSINNKVKVIISSGFLDSSTRSDLLRRGIKDVLTKPYKFDLISSTVRRVIEND
ncbi:MAG: PAS domain S-box protein [Bacteriovoracaceae bacterium]|nr:PAS domain S-box protein [Bacteroidota bacterium]